MNLDTGWEGLEAYASPSFFYRTVTSLSAKIQTLYLKRMGSALEVWVLGLGVGWARLLSAQNELSRVLLAG